MQYNSSGLSRIGHTEVYGGTSDPGKQSWGWSNVTLQTNVGQSGVLIANVTKQAQKDLAAWGLPSTTKVILKGIEIGTEGFKFSQLNVDFVTTAFVTVSAYANPSELDWVYSPHGLNYQSSNLTVSLSAPVVYSTSFTIAYSYTYSCIIYGGKGVSCTPTTHPPTWRSQPGTITIPAGATSAFGTMTVIPNTGCIWGGVNITRVYCNTTVHINATRTGYNTPLPDAQTTLLLSVCMVGSCPQRPQP